MFTTPATHVWDIPEPEPIVIPNAEPDRESQPSPAEPVVQPIAEPESVPA